MKKKKLIIPLPILIGIAVVIFGGIGIVGALNGWFGGGSLPSDTMTRGLVGYWNFDEGSGTTVADASGSGKHGVAAHFACGDTVTFTYKGGSVTYGTVTSTDRCWLDRNLGASQVATTYNDSNAYGDLFQWGRLDDSHQTRTSNTTTTASSSDNPGHSKFIYGVGDNWRSPANENLWQGVSGINNPCPSGWRLPTQAEWETERLSWSSNNYNGAYASPLKLTTGGLRSGDNAVPQGVNTLGRYWTTTAGAFSNTAYGLGYWSGGGDVTGSYGRASGLAVRCIKD